MEDISLPAYEKAQSVDIREIPIVDFSGFLEGDRVRQTRCAAEIAASCEQVGFLYLINHGVPQDLIDRTFDVTARFFEQSREERQKSAATLEHWRGFVPAKLQAEGGTVAGSLETYRLMLDLQEDDPDVLARKPLHLPNRWPEQPADFKEVVQAYFEAVLQLSAQLSMAFARALLLPDDYFALWYRKPLVQLSLLHYRPHPASAQGSADIGAGEHRDTGGFTLLMQDQTGGLEVQRKDGVWIGAPPIKGAYVVNIGDIMTRWTNGRFVSTPHRVVNRSNVPRYSIPFFANPDYDAIIEPIADILLPGEAPQYQPLHNGTYMKEFYDGGMDYLRPS